MAGSNGTPVQQNAPDWWAPFVQEQAKRFLDANGAGQMQVTDLLNRPPSPNEKGN
jgi:hypothetical protein